MKTKLTWRLDKTVIEKAKIYANQKQSSLSRFVENYFRFLVEENTVKSDEISSLIKELSGTIKLYDKFDLEKEYIDFVAGKYR